MGTVEESERFVKSLSPEKRKLFKEKLIERIMQIQTSEPWNESKPDYNELEDKSFQELCHLLNIAIHYEALDQLPPWPSELRQQHPRRLKGFRVFLTHKVYEKINSLLLSNKDLEVYLQAVEMGLGKYPKQMPVSDNNEWGIPLDGFAVYGDELSLHAGWTKPLSCNDWEGFTVLSHRESPELSYFYPKYPKPMKEFFRLCLEIPVS